MPKQEMIGTDYTRIILQPVILQAVIIYFWPGNVWAVATPPNFLILILVMLLMLLTLIYYVVALLIGFIEEPRVWGRIYAFMTGILILVIPWTLFMSGLCCGAS